MNQFLTNLTHQVDQSLAVINNSPEDVLCRTGQSIRLFEEALDELKTFIVSYRFQDAQEEITFFKEIKPKLFCHLLFYQKVYHVESFRPKGGTRVHELYLQKELRQIHEFFLDNKEFYHYYNSRSTHLDDLYFLRGRNEILLHRESFYFERDSEFSTSCDFKVCKILANDLIEAYLKEELGKLKEPGKEDGKKGHFPKERLSWTASKIDLMEIIYEHHSMGSFNHGKASLKSITGYFETVFNIDLSHTAQRAWYDLTIRENPMAYLDKMRKAFLNRVDKYFAADGTCRQKNKKNNRPDKDDNNVAK